MRPDAGSIRLGEVELAGASAQRVARAGIARTYQTTQLFGSLSVLDNVLLGLRRGRLGNPFAAAAGSAERREAEEAPRFRRLRGPLGVPTRDLPTSTVAWWRSPARSPPAPACCCSMSPPPD